MLLGIEQDVEHHAFVVGCDGVANYEFHISGSEVVCGCLCIGFLVFHKFHDTCVVEIQICGEIVSQIVGQQIADTKIGDACRL